MKNAAATLSAQALTPKARVAPPPSRACGGCVWGVGEGYCAVLVVLCFSYGRGGGNRVVAERRARQNGRSGSRLAPSSQQQRPTETAKGTYVSFHQALECTQEKHREQEGLICKR